MCATMPPTTPHLEQGIAVLQKPAHNGVSGLVVGNLGALVRCQHLDKVDDESAHGDDRRVDKKEEGEA